MSRARNNPERQLRMQQAMTVEPQSYDALSAVSGLSVDAVAHWVRTLRKLEPAPLHIAAWAPDSRGRVFVALWTWGPGQDEPRPGQSRTPAERMAALRTRRKDQSNERTK